MKRTFDVKVVGYEAIQAESAEDAIEKFGERFLSKDYLLSDLRWKSITAYDVENSSGEPCELLLAEARRQLSDVVSCLKAALAERDAYERGERVYSLWVDAARKLV